MKQIDMIKDLAEMIRSEDLRRIFITEWLEDINWHSECAKLRNGFLQPQKIERLEVLNIARNKDRYTISHYKFLVDEGLVNAQDEADVQNLRAGNMIFLAGGSIDSQDLLDFNFALECAKTMSLAWGWGMSGIDQKTLIETLESIITNKKPLESQSTKN